MGSAFTAPIDVEFRATGVENVRNGMRLVKTEAEGLSHVSHGAIFGLAELSRGISRIAETGQASALGMRELSGGIMRLGASLGPGAGLVGIIAILGGVIVAHFMKAREEMKKTEEQFATSLGNMANAGRSTDLQRQTRDLLYGTPYDAKGQLQNPSAVSGAFQGSLMDLRSRIAMLTEQTRGLIRGGVLDTGQFKALDELVARAKPLEEQYQRLTTAILNVANQPASMSGLLSMKVTAARTQMFAHGDDSFANLLGGEQFKESALKRMLPGQIGDMSRSLIDQLKQDLDVEMLKGSNAKTTNDRVEALKKYAEILKQIDELSGKPGELGVLGGKGPRVAKLTESVGEILADAQVKIIKQINTDFTHGIEDALVSGLQDAFSGDGLTGLGKGFIKGMLGVLGDIAIQLGEAMIPIGAWLESFTAALFSLNGPAAIAAGVGLILAGGALKAGASAIGRSGGSHGGSSSYSAPTQIIDRGSINPVMSASNLMPRSPVSVTVIGERDPVAQSSLLRMIDYAQKRGGLS